MAVDAAQKHCVDAIQHGKIVDALPAVAVETTLYLASRPYLPISRSIPRLVS